MKDRLRRDLQRYLRPAEHDVDDPGAEPHHRCTDDRRAADAVHAHREAFGHARAPVIDQDDDGRRVRPWTTRLDELRPARCHLTAGAPGHPGVLLSRLDEASHDGARQGGVAATVVANVDDEATGRAQRVEGSTRSGCAKLRMAMYPRLSSSSRKVSGSSSFVAVAAGIEIERVAPSAARTESARAAPCRPESTASKAHPAASLSSSDSALGRRVRVASAIGTPSIARTSQPARSPASQAADGRRTSTTIARPSRHSGQIFNARVGRGHGFRFRFHDRLLPAVYLPPFVRGFLALVIGTPGREARRSRR